MKTRHIALTVGILLIATPVLFLFSQNAPRGRAGGGDEPQLILFSGPGFTGRELVLRDTVADLPVERLDDGSTFNWNDEVRSIIVVSGTWKLYQHGRCNTTLDDTPVEQLDLRVQSRVGGWSSLVSANSAGPMRIHSPETASLHRDISSIRLVSTLNLPDWAFVE